MKKTPRRRPAVRRRRLLAAAAFGLLLAASCGGAPSDEARADTDLRPAVAPPDSPAASAMPLPGSAKTPEATARLALERIASGDREGLLALALTETEFREVVYPELPASRPERNTSADYLWRGLRQKSRNALAFTFDRHAGAPLELLAVDFLGETTDYGTYRVHRKTALTVRAPDGKKSVVRVFGSMIERGGEYKIFSFVTD